MADTLCGVVVACIVDIPPAWVLGETLVVCSSLDGVEPIVGGRILLDNAVGKFDLKVIFTDMLKDERVGSFGIVIKDWVFLVEGVVNLEDK